MSKEKLRTRGTIWIPHPYSLPEKNDLKDEKLCNTSIKETLTSHKYILQTKERVTAMQKINEHVSYIFFPF